MNTPSAYFDGIDTHIPSASGGNIHTLDGYVVHEFTGSGTFIPAKTANYQIFMVGNGGGGNTGDGVVGVGGGGGGGGEVVIGSVKLTSGSSYGINFNDGDVGSYHISFAGIAAYNAGGGGDGYSLNNDGGDGNTGGTGTGGSGGGGATASGFGNGSGGQSFSGNGIINYLFRYGNDGGDHITAVGNGAGGGGGAGGQGGDTKSGTGNGGDGGNGITNDWLGSTLSYGGGGGGYPSGVGNGGGGNAATTTNGLASTPRANSGGGGGGTCSPSTPGSGNGAKGIVLIRYKTDV